jgi:hypothetical protein
MEYTSQAVTYADAVPEVLRLVLNDAQTSGGLLISVPGQKAGGLLSLLKDRGINAAVIGRVEDPSPAGDQGPLEGPSRVEDQGPLEGPGRVENRSRPGGPVSIRVDP